MLVRLISNINRYVSNTGRTLRYAITIVIAMGLMSGNVLAGDLAGKATNPIGDLVQLQLQYQHGSDIYDQDGNSDAYIVQPIIPFDLPFDSVPKMITRTTIPYVSTPDLPGSGSVEGLGDTVLLAFALPKLETKGIMVGIGPALGLPTASKDETGSDAWSLGPTVVYINTQTKSWMWGILTYGLWDVAGDGDRDDVSQINIQPLLFKYFDEGWYLGLQDITWTYNDETNDWFLPIGPRLGKTTKIGNQSLNIYSGAYYNPVDTTGTAEWTFKLSVSLLFPT